MAQAGPEPKRLRDDIRSIAQLNMLHNLAAALNMLGDVEEIAAAITAELRTIIDYHNCRVYLLQPDGDTLFPVAFRGELFTDYATESLPELVTKLGEGITGHVALDQDLSADARRPPDRLLASRSPAPTTTCWSRCSPSR